MSTLVFLVLIFGVINGQNCKLTINPSPIQTIVCDNTCNDCNIVCDTSGQCNSVSVYTAALNTNINCLGGGSCENMNIYAGHTFGIYPKGYDGSSFGRTNYNSFLISCTGTTSCSGMRLIINGNYINGAIVNADSNGGDSFKDGYLHVSILETQIFNLICGLSTTNCGDTTEYICNRGNCQCNGVTHGLLNGCATLAGNFIMRHCYV